MQSQFMTILSFDPQYDRDLQSTKQMIQMALLLIQENNCAKLFRNPCTKVGVMAQTSSIYDHFII